MPIIKFMVYFNVKFILTKYFIKCTQIDYFIYLAGHKEINLIYFFLGTKLTITNWTVP